MDKNTGRGVNEDWAEILALPLTSRGHLWQATWPLWVSASSFEKWERYPTHVGLREAEGEKRTRSTRLRGSVQPAAPTRQHLLFLYCASFWIYSAPLIRLWTLWGIKYLLNEWGNGCERNGRPLHFRLTRRSWRITTTPLLCPPLAPSESIRLRLYGFTSQMVDFHQQRKQGMKG